MSEITVSSDKRDNATDQMCIFTFMYVWMDVRFGLYVLVHMWPDFRKLQINQKTSEWNKYPSNAFVYLIDFVE